MTSTYLNNKISGAALVRLGHPLAGQMMRALRPVQQRELSLRAPQTSLGVQASDGRTFKGGAA